MPPGEVCCHAEVYKLFPVCKMIKTVLSMTSVYLPSPSALDWHAKCNFPYDMIPISPFREELHKMPLCTWQPFISIIVVICCLLLAKVVIRVSMWLIMFPLQELNGLHCCSEKWEATCCWFSGCRLQCKKAQVSSGAALEPAAHTANDSCISIVGRAG